MLYCYLPFVVGYWLFVGDHKKGHYFNLVAFFMMLEIYIVLSLSNV